MKAALTILAALCAAAPLWAADADAEDDLGTLNPEEMTLGRVMEEASREQLYADPQHPYTRALLSAAPIPDPAAERSRARIKLIGVIPESQAVLQASNQGTPSIHLSGTDVSEAYKDVVDRFLGADKPIRFLDAPKVGLLKRLFGG